MSAVSTENYTRFRDKVQQTLAEARTAPEGGWMSEVAVLTEVGYGTFAQLNTAIMDLSNAGLIEEDPGRLRVRGVMVIPGITQAQAIQTQRRKHVLAEYRARREADQIRVEEGIEEAVRYNPATNHHPIEIIAALIRQGWTPPNKG